MISDRLFWYGYKHDRQVHICLKEPNSGRKCTKFWNKRSKWAMCENTLNLHLHQAQIQSNRGQWRWKEIALDHLSLSMAEDTHCSLLIHAEHTDGSGLFSFPKVKLSVPRKARRPPCHFLPSYLLNWGLRYLSILLFLQHDTLESEERLNEKERQKRRDRRRGSGLLYQLYTWPVWTDPMACAAQC